MKKYSMYKTFFYCLPFLTNETTKITVCITAIQKLSCLLLCGQVMVKLSYCACLCRKSIPSALGPLLIQARRGSLLPCAQSKHSEPQPRRRAAFLSVTLAHFSEPHRLYHSLSAPVSSIVSI